jgi:hypothetical protein
MPHEVGDVQRVGALHERDVVVMEGELLSWVAGGDQGMGVLQIPK